MRFPKLRQVAKCVVGVLILISYPVVENLREANRHGQEASAIGTLREIGTAQSHFRESRSDELRYGSLSELVEAGLLDESLREGTRSGYRFEVHPSPTTPEFLWCASATPLDPSAEQRHFGTNHAGVTGYSLEGSPVTRGCELDPSAHVT